MGSKPCCETKSVSAKDAQSAHELFTISSSANAIAEEPVTFEVPAAGLFPANELPKVSDIPDPQQVSPLFILFCVFRI